MSYELNNRPDWAWISIAGAAALRHDRGRREHAWTPRARRAVTAAGARSACGRRGERRRASSSSGRERTRIRGRGGRARRVRGSDVAAKAGTDYGYRARRRRAAARSGEPLAAGWGARARPRWSTPPPSAGATRVEGRRARRLRASTSCTSAPSRRKAPSTRPHRAARPSCWRWASRRSRSCRWPSFPGRATGATTACTSTRRTTPTAGRRGCKRLVDAAHAHGLGVVLDVVYNHVGPEGNYLDRFGPYFTDVLPHAVGPRRELRRRRQRRGAPLGARQRAVLDHRVPRRRAAPGRGARHLRLRRAARSSRSCRTRCTSSGGAWAARSSSSPRATSMIRGSCARRSRAATASTRSGPTTSTTRSTRRSPASGTATTRTSAGSRRSPTCIASRFVYDGGTTRASAPRARPLVGRRAAPALRRRARRTTTRWATARRASGSRRSCRPTARGSPPRCVLLSPYVPLLFMGEEYGETAPFLYFVSHGDPTLVDAVREGRRKEFDAIGWGDEQFPIRRPRRPSQRSRLALGAPRRRRRGADAARSTPTCSRSGARSRRCAPARARRTCKGGRAMRSVRMPLAATSTTGARAAHGVVALFNLSRPRRRTIPVPVAATRPGDLRLSTDAEGYGGSGLWYTPSRPPSRRRRERRPEATRSPSTFDQHGGYRRGARGVRAGRLETMRVWPGPSLSAGRDAGTATG